jgi:hypothetical protein
MKCSYKRNITVRSCNNYGRGKTIIIIYSECMFVALVIQHAMRMRHIILPSVACLALRYFPTLSHKRQELRVKTFFEQKMCVLFFLQISSETFQLLRINRRHIITNEHRSQHKVPVTLGTT